MLPVTTIPMDPGMPPLTAAPAPSGSEGQAFGAALVAAMQETPAVPAPDTGSTEMIGNPPDGLVAEEALSGSETSPAVVAPRKGDTARREEPDLVATAALALALLQAPASPQPRPVWPNGLALRTPTGDGTSPDKSSAVESTEVPLILNRPIAMPAPLAAGKAGAAAEVGTDQTLGDLSLPEADTLKAPVVFKDQPVASAPPAAAAPKGDVPSQPVPAVPVDATLARAAASAVTMPSPDGAARPASGPGRVETASTPVASISATPAGQQAGAAGLANPAGTAGKEGQQGRPGKERGQADRHEAPLDTLASTAPQQIAQGPVARDTPPVHQRDASAPAAPAAPLADPQALTAPRPTDRVTLRFEGEHGLEGRVRIAVRGTTLHAAISAPESGAASRLEQNIGELRQALADRGFTDAQITVRHLGESTQASTPRDGSHARGEREQPRHHPGEDRPSSRPGERHSRPPRRQQEEDA